MIVYKPIFTTKWEVWELDSDLLRYLTSDTVAYFKDGVGFYGTLYHAKSIFKSKEAAWKWVSRDFVPDEDFYRVGK